MKKIILLLILLIFISGCAEEKEADVQEKEVIEEFIGPGGCALEEYEEYCQKNPEECEKWCEKNPEICPEYVGPHKEEADVDIYKNVSIGKPNIVLIYVDTLRADHLGSYGYERETSPNIDRLANDGVLFLNHISQGPTDLPAIPSFLTSLYYPNHRFNFPDKPLRPELTTIAEVLKDNGYETAAFISPKPWFSEGGYGLMQGFKTFTVSYENTIQKDVLSWLDQNNRRPFFLMVQYAFTHGPYDAPEPYKKMFVEDKCYDKYPDAPGICEDPWRGVGCIPNVVAEKGILDIDYYVAKFDGEIRYTDDLVLEVVKRIENMGIADGTILIFMGDHGESLGAHNTFFHHEFLYDNTIKPPLIIKYPRKIPKNKTITNQVQSIDIYPTILDLANISLPIDIDGLSLMPLIEGTSNRECNAFSFEGDWAAIRTKKWKYILNKRKAIKELYDLESDPDELINNRSQNLKIARELRSKVESCIRGDCPSDCK